MSGKFPVHWLENIANEIIDSNVQEITLAAGKTPSGHIHIGILRELIICDALKRIFKNRKINVKALLFLDDLDAAKRFPGYIDPNFQKKHLGKPFALIPCPIENCGCESYAYHFGNKLISSLKEFGIDNEIIWTHDLYKQKVMQEKIKIALEKAEDIKLILRKYILPTLDDQRKEEFLEMQKSWLPIMAICEKCHRIQNRLEDGTILPNRVLHYNTKKETVNYKCSACGHKDEISIYQGNLKLNWRIDWPAKWAIFQTTCEPAGKDHCVKGGSYDTGLEICEKIFKYHGPIKIPYEWLRLGKRDMKTSKGIVFTPNRYLELADSELFRMLILRTNPMKHISFRIEEIPQYQDYYDKMENIYFNVDKAESKEENEFYKYLYPLTKINFVSDKRKDRVPLKLLIFLVQVQNILSLDKLYKKTNSILQKENINNELSLAEFNHLLERTEKWINEVKIIIENEKDEKIKRNILNKTSFFTILEQSDSDLTNSLTQEQISGLKLLREFLIKNSKLDANSIQNKIFTIAKEDLNISPKKLFEAIYIIILGKKYGPRLGTFLSMLDKKWLIERLNLA